ncbi:hypothetical protein NFJ02_22g48520 [Pycnococcus provasolii]
MASTSPSPPLLASSSSISMSSMPLKRVPPPPKAQGPPPPVVVAHVEDALHAYRQGYADGLGYRQESLDDSGTPTVVAPPSSAAHQRAHTPSPPLPAQPSPQSSSARLAPFIEQLRHDHLGAIAEAEHARSALAETASKTEEIKSRLRDTKMERDSHKRVSESLHAQLLDTRKELDHLRSAVHRTPKEQQTNAGDVARLEARLEEERRLREANAKAHEDALKGLREENARLNATLATGWSSMSREADSRVAKLEEDLRRASEARDSAQTRITEMNAEIAKAEAFAAKAEVETANIRTELENLREDLRRERRRADAFEASATLAREEANGVQSRLNSLKVAYREVTDAHAAAAANGTTEAESWMRKYEQQKAKANALLNQLAESQSVYERRLEQVRGKMGEIPTPSSTQTPMPNPGSGTPSSTFASYIAARRHVESATKSQAASAAAAAAEQAASHMRRERIAVVRNGV